MSNQIWLLIHPTFGVLGMLAALWVFVEALNASENNIDRMRMAAKLSTVFIWLAYFTAGYFYVLYYGGDKALIKAGPWPFAHGLFMESKEHLFFIVLLLATFLPIATQSKVYANKSARNLVLWSSAFVVLAAMAMEGAGAIIGMGVKVALLAKVI